MRLKYVQISGALDHICTVYLNVCWCNAFFEYIKPGCSTCSTSISISVFFLCLSWIWDYQVFTSEIKKLVSSFWVGFKCWSCTFASFCPVVIHGIHLQLFPIVYCNIFCKYCNCLNVFYEPLVSQCFTLLMYDVVCIPHMLCCILNNSHIFGFIFLGLKFIDFKIVVWCVMQWIMFDSEPQFEKYHL